ncbi:hypothetical protein CSOJ01_14593 [Colletotrichum sojae]|uniref:Uncharacterized protein n=1 Tax=Colletotrichum sojae TaxID=2175907 RepID=A0A8H6IPM4_9PEZI|nr:hypothetical protein CSOJ01_14593 [Colletotrichum sojae]
MLGSCLCDVLSRPRGGGEHATSPSLLLSVSVISTLADIYHLGRGGDVPEAATHQMLQAYSDASVMEFHLTHLPAVFVDCQFDGGMSGQEMGKALQGFMDRMRPPPRRCGWRGPDEPLM